MLSRGPIPSVFDLHYYQIILYYSADQMELPGSTHRIEILGEATLALRNQELWIVSWLVGIAVTAKATDVCCK